MLSDSGGGVVSLLTVYVGGYLALVLLALCLATGLYYIAELVEEYSRVAKRVITIALRCVLALHAALLLLDRQPVACVLVGAAAHGAYARLLPRFPAVRLLSADAGAALALLLLSHALWLRHFYYDTYASAEYVAGFFVVAVWLVPFGFFISLSANADVLPMGGGNGAGGLGASAPPFASATAARDAAAYSRSRGGSQAPAEGRGEGRARAKSRNLVAAALGGALRWVQGKRGGGVGDALRLERGNGRGHDY